MLGAFVVDDDRAELAALLVDGAVVAVPDGSLADGPAPLCLRGQAFGDFSGEVAGIELGDRAHDAVQQHPGRGGVDGLSGRDELDVGGLESANDLDVIAPVAGQPVELVNNHVVDVVVVHVLQHPLQLGPVG